jgi:acetyltransferase-like isoleucine patch superfamily enzyme
MGQVTMGAHSYGSPIRRGDMNEVIIGKYCSIAHGVIFDSGFNHNMTYVSTYPFNSNWAKCGALTGHPLCKGDIIVGNDVWIGEDAMIMSGITIGDGAVIGARAIVTKDVAPYSMVAGMPAEFKKFRFSEEQIKVLLNIQWWYWSDEKVLEASHLIMSPNIDEFISYAQEGK